MSQTPSQLKYTKSIIMGKSKLCACGKPAKVMKNSSWVCQRCDDIEHARNVNYGDNCHTPKKPILDMWNFGTLNIPRGYTPYE